MSRATFLPSFVSCIAWFAALLGSGLPISAAAADAAQRETERGPRFATIWRIRGEVTASIGESGPQRTLRTGDAVFVGENVRADSAGEAVLKTDDAGIVAVRPGAAFVVERFSAAGRASDHFSLRLVTGALRMITGWIGRSNRAEYEVRTATATIGIRGTDHEPYVLSADLAQSLRQAEGTYDKVNRGGTTMDVNGNRLDIEAGRVGFARAPPRVRTRGLLTILLPVLLDSVPDFYVPGAFDAELDRLSAGVEAEAMRALKERGETSQDTPPASPPSRKPPVSAQIPPAPATPVAPALDKPAPSPPEPSMPGDCDANAIARAWLGAFDAAVVERNVLTIVRLFAPDVAVRANVRGADGTVSTLEMSRDQLAQSTVAALKGLTDYQQRRPSIEARITSVVAGECHRINVRSVAIEQGRQGGRPYRFEALEEYVLEQRDGQWLAISAVTTQR